MPPLQTANRYATAILVSDIHLSHKPPIARSEEDWYAVQKGYLEQLSSVAGELPIICGGDILHKWSCPPELINLALRHLPTMYSVAGNHDLPHHRYDDIKRSAYWTLVEAGKVINLGPGTATPIVGGGACGIRLHAFPWGYTPSPAVHAHSMMQEVAVVHAFVWTESTGYPGAPPDQRLKQFKRKLRGYDTVLFGDNHKSVFWNLDRGADAPAIFNPGGFMRRNTDQVDHRPCVGILHNDGTVQPHYLDTSSDKLMSNEATKTKERAEKEFVKLLGRLIAASDLPETFRQAVEQCLDTGDIEEDVKCLVLEAMDRANV